MNSSQFEIPQKQPSAWKKMVLFTEIGLFEIGFVTALLVIVLGTLTYFHIIHLSPILQLLPSSNHKNESMVIDQNTKDRMNITNFIMNTIQTQYVNPTLQFKSFPQLPTDNKSSILEGLTSTWTANNTQVTAKEYFDDPEHTISSFSILISDQSKVPITDPVGTISAQKIFNTYYRGTAPSQWHCYSLTITKMNQTVYICETVQNKNSTKIGYTIQTFNTNPNLLVTFSCLIPQRSKHYKNYEYCIP